MRTERCGYTKGICDVTSFLPFLPFPTPHSSPTSAPTPPQVLRRDKSPGDHKSWCPTLCIGTVIVMVDYMYTPAFLEIVYNLFLDGRAYVLADVFEENKGWKGKHFWERISGKTVSFWLDSSYCLPDLLYRMYIRMCECKWDAVLYTFFKLLLLQ